LEEEEASWLELVFFAGAGSAATWKLATPKPAAIATASNLERMEYLH
jgi:hypothetical protein